MKKLFTPLKIIRGKKKKETKESLTGFKNKRITVMGLGLIGGGVGVARFFVRQGAEVLVTDLRTKRELRPSLEKLKGLPIKYILGRHREQDFNNADLIIKNPAVASNSPYLEIARENNIPIKTDIEIFFDLCSMPAKGGLRIIGVTGTKGKSTTATLIYKILETKFPNTFLAGNIGLTPLEILPKIKKDAMVVLELSSFELEDLKKSPHIAVITTLFPDHLNRYKNFNDYIEAKKSIFKYQKRNDILVLNYNNKETRKLAKEAPGKVLFFKDSNVSAAITAVKIFKIPEKNIKKVLSKFKGVSGRQELIAVKKGVRYINDTTATTPQSVILAIKTFRNNFPKAKIILIAGGVDKGLNYKGIAKEIKKNIAHLILLPGTASDKIKKELFDTWSRIDSRERASVDLAKSMEQAVKRASQLAQKDDIVLLSPSAASFNLFKNEFDRGEQFVKAVKKL
ncbi:MAG: UDP-N-acetylmuramoyl-L-alanine--D-glutamate ligase [Candidatus Nealsonbacteria bacterium]|nr:UDP-N-acetylmuramoyl-L-alanine--D-glutamate ligase [Candidatus Nealsonbacteria bacterium]